MADRYLYTPNPDGSSGKVEGLKFLVGRVKDIVLGPYKGDGRPDASYKSPKDIGKIYFEILYANTHISNAQMTMQAAYPIFAYVKQYPLLGEMVYIVPGPDSDLNDSINRQGYYYFPPYNTWNSPQHNIFPNLEEYAQFLKDSNAKSGPKNKMIAIPAGRTFQEQRDIRTLRPFEGDTIIESRFGQSLRFGSTVVGASQLALNSWSNSGKNGSPILIIRNGQGIQETNDYFDTTAEDINKDLSSVWMTSDQNIIFTDLTDYPLASYYGKEEVKQNVTVIERQLANLDAYAAADVDKSNNSPFVIT